MQFIHCQQQNGVHLASGEPDLLEQLAQIDIGSAATVDFDSNQGGPLTGHVTSIGGAAALPPTSFPTTIVHMTRAVRVTIELDSGRSAPQGTPVDIEIVIGR